jgi:hypothetical protein
MERASELNLKCKNLNISDVSENKKYFDIRYILELVRDKIITIDKGTEKIMEYFNSY